MRISTRILAPGVIIALLSVLAPPARAQEWHGGELVLLAETGGERDGLPIYELHEGGEDITEALTRGLSGKVLRLYQRVQTYLQMHEQRAPEPAYLLLSSHQGGFARYGFFLGAQERRDSAYVDLKGDWPVTGHFSAMDQIFPHEMAHIIRRLLAGELVDGGTNQVHAIAVRTDPVVAFNEGFAEHFQVMATDDPEALPATRALADDLDRLRTAERHLELFRRELEAKLAIATRMRMGFLAWYSNDEDVLRYHAVKANAFARVPELPAALLARADPYSAYLLENMLPGAPEGAPKAFGRMVATEGVISALFLRWANDAGIRNNRGDAEFYAQFGAAMSEVGPLENVYLKLAHALYLHRPQRVLELIDGYKETFPQDAPRIDALVADVFLGQRRHGGPEIWLANTAFQTGTTLFDQYRGLPRPHTFDLNSASVVDLVSVPGIDAPLAREIQAAGPYEALTDLRRVPGFTDALIEQFELMERDMVELRAVTEEDVETLSINSILIPYGRRLVAVVLVGAALGGLIQRAVRGLVWWRAIVNGAAATVVGVAAGWVTGLYGVVSIVLVLGLLGMPACAWSFWRHRNGAEVLRLAYAWAAAAVPAAVMVTPWF